MKPRGHVFRASGPGTMSRKNAYCTGRPKTNKLFFISFISTAINLMNWPSAFHFGHHFACVCVHQCTQKCLFRASALAGTTNAAGPNFATNTNGSIRYLGVRADEWNRRTEPHRARSCTSKARTTKLSLVQAESVRFFFREGYGSPVIVNNH